MMHFYHDEIRQTEPVGNNALSYAERMALGSQGKIHIAALVDGTVDNLTLGKEIVFEEVEDGKLISCKGVQSLLRIQHDEKTIYITDNHNHALYFWYEAWSKGMISSGTRLLHVDQHADMNDPEGRIDVTKENDLDYIATYVNTKTQIASFIQPAVRSGLLKECVQIRTETKLQEMVEQVVSGTPGTLDYVLDIDIDFFAHEADINAKIALLKRLISSASLVTIATSPFFIDQQRALEIIKKLLSSVDK